MLFSAKTMTLAKRHLLVSGDVIKAFIDYLVAKGADIKDVIKDENQDVEGRIKTDSQQKWENFASLVQYAKHLQLNTKRSGIDFLEEVIESKVKAVQKAVKAKIRDVQDITRSKIETVQEAADTVSDKFNKYLYKSE